MRGREGEGRGPREALREDAAPVEEPGKRSLTEMLGRPFPGRPTTPGQRTLTDGLAGAGRIPPSIASILAAAQGVPLPNPDEWSRRVGADVRDARIVTGEGAAEAAAAVGAKAFTVGNRVFFGAGYDPSSEGGALLEHELAHVVQQRGAPAPASADQLAVLPYGDHREAEARAGASPAVGTSEQAIARDPEPDIDASTYRRHFAEKIGNGIAAYLAAHEQPTGSRFLMFPQVSNVIPIIPGITGTALEAKLDEWLGVAQVTHLINKARPMGREEVTFGGETSILDEIGHGPDRWFPDVATELAGALSALIRQSLDRIVSRYQRAALATAIAAEEEARQSLPDPPKPAAGDILASHPFDAVTIRALIDHAHFDIHAYRLAYPGERGALGQLRPVQVSWEAPYNHTYWARVSPVDATVEEVANALYGTSTKSGELTVVASPLFGLGNTDDLLPEHRTTLQTMCADLNRPPGDVTEAAVTGPLADEIAQNQGALTPGQAATKGAVLRTIDESLAIIPTIEQSGARFGMGQSAVKSLAPLTTRLTERRQKINAASEEDALKWSGQTEAQQEILTSIAFGFDREATRLDELTRMVTDATVKLGGFNLPPHVRTAMYLVAIRYADCALISDAPQTAAIELAKVEDEAAALPVTFLEGTLASIQYTLDNTHTLQHVFDAVPLAIREQQLKARLTAVRAQIKTDPEGAMRELSEIAKLISDLQIETEMVANMDQIDVAWQALDEGVSYWWSSSQTWQTASELKDEGDRLHDRWQAVFADWKSGDPARQAQARIDFESLRTDPALAEWLGRVQSTLKSAQIERLISEFVVLIAITVVTVGVGELVAGAAAGWELSAGATAIVAGGAEAGTFTLLSQIFIDSDHNFGHVLYELATNWALFGLMRRFQMFAEVAKLGKVAAVGGNLLILAATTYAKADLDTYIREGRHLNADEVKMIALQGMAMAIAMHAIAPMSEPLFKELEDSGYAFAKGLKENNQRQGALSVQAEAIKGTRDFAQAQEYVAQETEWLEERVEILGEVEEAVAEESTNGSIPEDGGLAAKIHMSPEELSSLRTELEGNLEGLEQGTVPIALLEPKGPGLFTCPREHIAEVVQSLGEVQGVTINPETTVKTYEVKLPDNTVIKVMERINPAPDAPVGLPSDAQARREIAELHGISDAKALQAFDALCDVNPVETVQFLRVVESQPGLANRLLNKFGDSALQHFKPVGEPATHMIEIHGDLELSAGKLDSLSTDDIVKLVDLCKSPEQPGDYEYFESTSTKNGKPGARLRFESRLELRTNEVITGIMEVLPPGTPRPEIFDGMTDADVSRLWDLFAERGYGNKEIRAQAAEWALSKNPSTVSEFVAEFQFYNAEVSNRAAQILADLEAQPGATPGRALAREATRRAIAEMAGTTTGADGVQTTVGAEAADAAWDASLAAQTGSNAPGTTPIGVMSDAELPGYVQSIADDLGFSNESEAAYHAHKHAREVGLDPSLSPADELTAYLQAARDFIESHDGTVRYNQNGSRSVAFTTEDMFAVVNVSTDGQASIATFMKASR